jgi:TRAP-type C4-dicarboxylate transport system substrate-binding protein
MPKRQNLECFFFEKERGMVKRQMLKFIFFLALVMCLALPAGPAASLELKIATLSPDGSAWMQKMRQGLDEVAEKTSNRVRFKFYPGGIMGNDKAVLRKIRAGQLHGGFLTGGSLIKVFSDAQVYSLPLKFRSLQEIDYVRERMDHFMMTGFEKGGFVTFGLAEGGFAYVMSKASVRSVEELRNQKVWVPDHDPTISKAMHAFGITPIPLPIADVRASLQTGLIDTVTVSPIGAIVLQWHTQVKYLTELPLAYVYGLMVVERRAFMKISPKDQEIVRQAMEHVFEEIDRQNRTANIEALKVLRNLGIQFVEPVLGTEGDWFAVAAGVTQRLVDSGVVSKTIVNVLDGHLEAYRSQRSEKR